ncbi:MAG: hypothetical protein WCL53_06355 [Chloroflexota bacterium]
MPGIWSNSGSGWQLLATKGFPDEAKLHALVAEAPQLLPLAGSPQLAVVGSEVQLGSGYADLIAVESSGRMVVIEVKLARNAEARRAIVSQVLAYAAYLHGMDVEQLETKVLARHLASRDYESLLDAARKNDQERAIDSATFESNLRSFLNDGRFRLVLVLDDAPAELVKLVGYLGAVADKLLIDLITVSAFEVGGAQVLMPQRVDPEPVATVSTANAVATPAAATGRTVEGADDFEAAIATAQPNAQGDLRRYTDWAKQLESQGLARLQTYHALGDRLTLLPLLRAEGVGMVTIWSDRSGAYLQLWRSVIQRNAPQLVVSLEAALAPTPLRQGNSARGVSDEVLSILSQAYRTASASPLVG